MSIYKKAQAFQNSQAIKSLLEKIRRESELSTNISVLSQVRSRLDSEGLDNLEAIISEEAPGYSRGIRNFIDGIGLQAFTSLPFSNISDSLYSLWSEIHAPEPSATPESQIPGVAAPQPSDAISLLSLTPEERYNYFMGLDYPKEFQRRAEHIIGNFGIMERVLADQNAPAYVSREAQGDLVNAMSTLLRWARGEFEPEELSDTDVGKKPFIPAEFLETDEKEETKDTDSEEEAEGEEVSVSSGPAKKTRSTEGSQSSKMDEEEALLSGPMDSESIKQFLQRSTNPYIDFSVDPPELNERGMQDAFQNMFIEVDRVRREALTPGANFSSLKRRLNDTMYSIKVADTKAFKELKEYKDLILEDEEKMAQYKKLESEFLMLSPSMRILEDIMLEDDTTWLDSLFFAAHIVGAPKLADVIFQSRFNHLQKTITEKNMTVINESHFDKIQETMFEWAQSAFYNKAKDFFKLDRFRRANDFILETTSNYNITFNRSIKIAVPSGPTYSLRPCPTCYKMVKWSASKKLKSQNAELYTGFRTYIVSPFIEREGQPPQMITEEYLSSRSWPAIPAGDYSRARERKLAMQYEEDGIKSWEYIKECLRSSDPAKQEEGWHRRAGALLSAGGKKLSAKDKFINYLVTECPFDADASEGSFCGLSVQPTGSTSLSSGLSLQPQWSGQKYYSEDDNQNNSDSLNEEDWEDKELFQKAKTLLRGGHKFSRINFACTAHIEKIGALASYKYGNVVISKRGAAGSGDFVYPTKPNGALNKDIPNGTISFMVCGAPTSLSSFDRNENSPGFILKTLKDLRESSEEDYAEFLNILIASGVDALDIMTLHGDLERFIQNQEIEKISVSKERMKKISKLLATASGMGMYPDSNQDRRRLLGKLNLVCPFGHKFNIEHSLKFGESYAGIFGSSNVASKFSDLITTTGFDNLKALFDRGFLSPVDDPDVADFPNKLEYDEWIKLEPSERTVFPEIRKKEQALLIFNLPVNINGDMEQFVFNKKGQGWKSDIWDPNRSYESPRVAEIAPELSEEAKGAQSEVVFGEDGKALSRVDKAQAEQWAIDQGNDILDGDLYTPSKIAVPGTEVFDPEDIMGIGKAEEILDAKIRNMAEVIKASLRVTETWTKGVVSERMVAAIFEDTDINLTPFTRSSIRVGLKPYLKMYLYDEEGIPSEDMYTLRSSPLDRSQQSDISIMVSGMVTKGIERFSNNIYSWIRDNVFLIDDPDFLRAVSKKIIAQGVIHGMADVGPEDIVDKSTGKPIAEVFIEESDAEDIAEAIIRADESIIDFLTLRNSKLNETVRKKIAYMGRVSLVSYARYLALSLSKVYKKYFSGDNEHLYVGYDLGIDLSSPEKILGREVDGEWVGGINEEDVFGITDSYDKAAAQSGSFKRISSENYLTYHQRLDRAWQDLNGYLNNARKQVFSARGMDMAREFLISRISNISGERYEDVANIVRSTNPTKTILLNGTTEQPEMGNDRFIKKRIPYVSKELPFVRRLTEVQEWVLVSRFGNRNYAFNSKEEAQSFLEQLTQEDPGKSEEYQLTYEPYYVDEETCFDSSKTQIGVVSPRAGGKDDVWPPPPGRWGNVGIMLPFENPGYKKDGEVNKSSNALIPGYRFVIDFDGEPLDITMLIRKGRTSDDLKVIKASEDAIKSAQEEYRLSVERFKRENQEAISNDPTVLEDFIAAEETALKVKVRGYLRNIDRIQPVIETKACFSEPNAPRDGVSFDTKPGKNREIRNMSRFILEDPITCYKIIKNPQLRGRTLDDSQKKALVDFIMRVFNLTSIYAAAKESDPTYQNMTIDDFFTKYKSTGQVKKMMSIKTLVYEDGEEERVGWGHVPGEYFDVIGGSQENDTGSYFQYIYDLSAGNSKAERSFTSKPKINELINSGLAAVRNKLTSKHLEGEDEEGLGLAEKIETDMFDYIRSSAERKRSGRAKNKRAAGEYNVKISLRRSELDRMILSLGRFDFSDVEMPKF